MTTEANAAPAGRRRRQPAAAAPAATPDIAQKAQAQADAARAAELKAIDEAAKARGVEEAKKVKEADAAAKAKVKEAEAAAKDAKKKAEAAKKEADALKRKTELEAAKAKKKAEADKARELKKAAAEGAKKAKHTEAYRQLTPIGKEVNIRFEKADKLIDQADDHRLAAALKLEEARNIAEAAGLQFKVWVAENISQSYETVRKLVTVAQSEDPAKALADMREKNKAANKAMRERKAAENQGQIAAPTTEAANAAASGTVAAKASETLASLKPDQQLGVIKAHAENLGMAVVSATEKKTLDQLAKTGAKAGTLDAAKAAFAALKPSDKMKMVEFAAIEVGMKLVSPLPTDDKGNTVGAGAGEPVEKLTEIPEAFRK